MPRCLCCLAAVVVLIVCADWVSAQTLHPLNYPAAPLGTVVDDYHGVRVADPYRWLEDLDSAATQAWVASEARLTDRYVAALPMRATFSARIGELYKHERFTTPFHGGDRYFYARNTGLQSQSVLYTMRTRSSRAEVALDPNRLSSDGHRVVVGYVPSRDGRLLAYGVSNSGSDWTEWRVRDVESGRDLPDVIRNTKYYAPVFAADSRGLYYSAFPAPAQGRELTAQDLGNAVFYHHLGSPPGADRKLLEAPAHRDWQYRVGLSADGRWLVATAGEGEVGDKGLENVYLIDLGQTTLAVQTMAADFRAAYEFIGSDSGHLFFLTTLDAPNGRVISIDPAVTGFVVATVIPQGPEPIALSEDGCNVSLVSHQLIVRTIQAAHSHVVTYGLDGKKIRDVPLPGRGSVKGFDGMPADRTTFYEFTGLITPPAVYEYDTMTGRSEVFRQPHAQFDPSALEEHELFYPARDGTAIPLQIIYRKGLQRDGQNPLLLYGYGGFGIAELPTFDPAHIAWLEHGGIYAIANIRGGAEYGERWHLQANRDHKQVVFNDFIDAAQWLIKSGYTSTPKLAILGGSNGGLLVGACLTQHPDLYGAVVAEVGVMDMLRFDQFGQGAGWTGEYGSPQRAADFPALRAYSPLHNVRPGTRYPATLIVTGDHDARVMPAHSFKFAAALQAAQAGPSPILLYVESSSGHGGGSTVGQLIDQRAVIYAFLADRLGMSR